MNEKAVKRLLKWDLAKLEKYIQALIEKVSQSVVQSRYGELKAFSSRNKVPEKDVYELDIEDNPEVSTKLKEAALNIEPLKQFSLCIEILLKTSDGDDLVLELWHLKLTHSEEFWDVQYSMYSESEAVFTSMMGLLKSVITVSRAVPAYKLSLKQSADTFVMLYRIFQDNPQIETLGKNPHINKIGEVFTPVGTISISVAYRSKDEMTVPPKKNSIMVNSGYFDVDLNAENTRKNNLIEKNQNNSYSQKVGAFANCTILPDDTFPDLVTLEKPFLNITQEKIQNSEEDGNKSISNCSTDVNFNSLDISWDAQEEDWIDAKMECEKLSTSEVSNYSDFVFVDMRLPFASFDSTSDLGAFFHDCQHAPQLSSLTSEQSLEEQVFDVTSQLEKFELSMTEFDSFVDSVCCPLD